MGRHLDERVEAQIYLKDKNEGTSVWDPLQRSDKMNKFYKCQQAFFPTVNNELLHYEGTASVA